MPSVRSVLGFCRHFALTWGIVVPKTLYRISLSCFVDPRGSLRFLEDVSGALDFAGRDRVLESLDVVDLFPGDGDVTLRAPFHTPFTRGGTGQLSELACLAHVVKSLRAETVFEIGTFTGRTTRVFALNAAPGARVYTLDLIPVGGGNITGRDWVGRDEAARIEPLCGDSAKFDFTPWQGRCDFVWVDGNHDYECVVRDTESALQLCRSNGWIGWHDYWHSTPWAGVTRAVREFRHRFERIHHVRGTTIVLGTPRK